MARQADADLRSDYLKLWFEMKSDTGIGLIWLKGTVGP